MGIELSVKEHQKLREHIRNFIVNNQGVKKSIIVSHFEKEGYRSRTIYNAIDKLDMDFPIKDKTRIGRLSTWKKGKVKEFTHEFLQSLMKSVKAKLRKIADNGVYSVLK